MFTVPITQVRSQATVPESQTWLHLKPGLLPLVSLILLGPPPLLTGTWPLPREAWPRGPGQREPEGPVSGNPSALGGGRALCWFPAPLPAEEGPGRPSRPAEKPALHPFLGLSCPLLRCPDEVPDS